MNVLRSGEYKKKDYDLHYKGKANGKDFVSSSFFIKNFSGEMIGMLCLNTDITLAENLIEATNRLLGSLHFGLQVTQGREPMPEMENLDTSLTTLIPPLMSRTIEKYGLDPDRLSQEERICIVQELAQQGVSAVKGGVAEIAAQLHISESTVYRYLKKKE